MVISNCYQLRYFTLLVNIVKESSGSLIILLTTEITLLTVLMSFSRRTCMMWLKDGQSLKYRKFFFYSKGKNIQNHFKVYSASLFYLKYQVILIIC